MKIFFVAVLLSTVCLVAKSNNVITDSIPRVGRPIADHVFSDVRHFPRKSASISEFKGKWLVLDFWSKGCVNCVQSFPKLNELQRTFKDDVQFLLVGINDQYSVGIENMFEKFSAKMKLELAVAFDSALFKRSGISGVPVVVVIDPQGIVRSVSHSLDEEDLGAIISNDSSVAKEQINLAGNETPVRDLNKVTLFPRSISSDEGSIQYKSVLSRCMAREAIASFVDFDKGFFQVTHFQVARLYVLAYFNKMFEYFSPDSAYGNYWMRPVLETANDSVFRPNAVSYNYSLRIPASRAGEQQVMKAMQEDLQRFFGYEASVEKRMMPCWNLVVTDPSARKKLKTKGGERNVVGDYGGYVFTNVPVGSVLFRISYNAKYSEMPYMDMTGIEGHIDLNLDAITTDRDDVVRALRKNGLDLVEGRREMNVIVLRDPNLSKN